MIELDQQVRNGKQRDNVYKRLLKNFVNKNQKNALFMTLWRHLEL